MNLGVIAPVTVIRARMVECSMVGGERPTGGRSVGARIWGLVNCHRNCIRRADLGKCARGKYGLWSLRS